MSPLVFKSATGTSSSKLNVVFVPASQDAAYQALRSDKKFIVQIMTTSAPSAPYGTFAWRYEEDSYFQPEAEIGSYVSATTGFNLKTAAGNSGLYVYWDPVKGATPSFQSVAGQIAAGDVYEFTLSWNEGDLFDSGDSNSAHQLIECSGRGTCDADSGKCNCLPGYTGEACQRSESPVPPDCSNGRPAAGQRTASGPLTYIAHPVPVPHTALPVRSFPLLAAACPNQCSGHGSCQTQLRFAVDGLSANAQGYSGAYEKEQQYGCKCDKGYRGPDCSQSKCRGSLGAALWALRALCGPRGVADH